MPDVRGHTGSVHAAHLLKPDTLPGPAPTSGARGPPHSAIRGGGGRAQSAAPRGRLDGPPAQGARHQGGRARARVRRAHQPRARPAGRRHARDVRRRRHAAAGAAPARSATGGQPAVQGKSRRMPREPRGSRVRRAALPCSVPRLRAPRARRAAWPNGPERACCRAGGRGPAVGLRPEGPPLAASAPRPCAPGAALGRACAGGAGRQGVCSCPHAPGVQGARGRAHVRMRAGRRARRCLSWRALVAMWTAGPSSGGRPGPPAPLQPRPRSLLQAEGP